MSKFRKDGKKELPAISTASLPDIVFMLLFFFMVATTMREVDLNVNIMVPEANEVTKLEKKDLVSNIYVGVPMRKFQKNYGTLPRIQLNDQFATVEDIQSFIASERESRKEELRNKLTTSLKVDQYTKMGIITDIKQELRKASSLKLNYSTRQTAE
ncbi:biopolymer transporter ExbD [Ancylomarina sp. 16SWW S1-10-2]|uniref:ExbD/TolR family protein n=1 Tax=Ancylomarina sp. 16SWW S1-10-2 TaxID=2499681 RepID=UPI0012AE91FC|nr:biopolymer transporter ExbD [Ancylomarina sp. 16SWW S1-10-2]MRT94161.1 biopolymer transporter ExbD [Ancylomarina sp. 16SWW S1-10-2]